jgi:hypothetical protein
LNAISGGYTRLGVRGGWQGGPEEQHYRYEVDVPDTAKARQFFIIYRKLLEARFLQSEIYIQSFPLTGVPGTFTLR